MCSTVEYARMVIKAGTVVPTIPVSADHQNGDWLDSDIYVGEWYMNVTDGKVYTRTPADVIVEVAISGGAAVNLYTADGTLTGTRVVSTAGNTLTFQYPAGGGSPGLQVQMSSTGWHSTLLPTTGVAVKATGQIMAESSAGSPVEASAILQAASSTKGFLPPRMTLVQRLAIVSPANFLMVAQTDGTAGIYVNLPTTGWDRLVMASEI